MLDIQTNELEANLQQISSIPTLEPGLNPSSNPTPALDPDPSDLNSSEQDLASSQKLASFQQLSWKRIRGGILFVVGWLLSPLCWWNDLIFNLPVAYGFGYLCRLVSSEWFIPGLIAGYWISNVIGILLMQFGAIDVVQKQPQERNPHKDLWTGVISSTVYTGIILALVQFHIIDLPSFFAEESAMNLGALLPIALSGQ